MNLFYSGTSNLVLPVPNKLYYPDAFKDKSRLYYYSHLQNTIEINQTFYKIPRAQTMAKWAEEVTDEFKFSFKLFKGFTHDKNFVYELSDLERFVDSINAVGQHAGCILIQLPPGVGYDKWWLVHRLLLQLSDLNSDAQWQLVLEVRNKTLYTDEVADELSKMRVGLVLHDKRPSTPPLNYISGPVLYMRLHGPSGDYRGSYADEQLEAYAEIINDARAEGTSVYVYFNNTLGSAWKDLERLNNMVSREWS